ncbi:MAG: LLM class flavin-dependent oxidoreductase [Actinomycetota bacterium]|nr:LLM class flavin-dependent oxidoreductase [Actinomycetota bacterium]
MSAERSGTRPKVGLVLPMFSEDPATVLGFARRAESLGYDGVFAFDHFFPPGTSPARPSLEAFTMLSAIAASTERIAVGTLVARAVIRPAGMLAKMAASIDELSGGRMIVAIGSGDKIDEPEHRAFGLPQPGLAERRAILEETVRAVQSIFAGEVWPGGDHVPRLEGPLVPPPNTPGGPPVWIGGRSSTVVQMAARVADGWNGWGVPLDEFRESATALRERASELSRHVEPTWAGVALVGADEGEAEDLLRARRINSPIEADLWNGSADAFAEHLRALAGAGATWAIVLPAGPSDRLELIAERAFPGTAAG